MVLPADSNDRLQYDDVDHIIVDGRQYRFTGDLRVNGVPLGGDVVSVQDRKFNAQGNGANATSAIQAALDYAETLTQHDGAFFPDREPRVVFPPGEYYSTTGLSIPQGVILDLQGGELRALPGTTDLVTLAGDRAGICNGFLQALAAPTGVNAIKIPVGTFQAYVQRCVFNSFGLSAIYVDGNAAWIDQCWAQNCLLDAATLSNPTGVLHTTVNGNDLWLTNSEFSASRASLSASGKAYGVALLGKVGNIKGVIAEISDHGWYLSGLGNMLTTCRADLNRGHGFVFDGGSGNVTGCYSLNNGRETTNTYDGFNFSGTTPQYQVAQCIANITLGNTHRYGFFDGASAFATRNVFASTNKSSGHGTAAVNVVQLAGGAVDPVQGPFLPITAASTVWNVQTYNGWPCSNWTLSSVAPVNFTTFQQIPPGMKLHVVGDGQTTFVHNASVLVLKSGANTLAVNGTIYEFIHRNGITYQL